MRHSIGRGLALAALLAALLAIGIQAQGSGGAAPDAKALIDGNWFISLRPGAQDRLRFFALGEADAGRLFLRRFSTPSFYLDAYSGRELRVLLWPEPKKRLISLTQGASSFVREESPYKLEYRRVKGVLGSQPYEGEWEIGEPPMTLAIRACEKRDWALAMYFPGDPLSAIPLGYYPLFATVDGGFRSSSAFPDSCLELEYDRASGALVLRPLFKDRPLAADLYDPVRAWRGK